MAFDKNGLYYPFLWLTVTTNIYKDWPGFQESIFVNNVISFLTLLWLVLGEKRHGFKLASQVVEFSLGHTLCFLAVSGIY